MTINKRITDLLIIPGIILLCVCCGCEKKENNGAGDNGDDIEDTINYYTNPVFTPSCADPTIIKDADGYFYCFSTEDNWGDRVHLTPIIRSKDLVNWQFVRDAFSEKPDWKSGSLWAPDIVYYDNKYFLFYSLSLWGDPNPGIGYAESESIQGPYTDQGKLFDSEQVGVANSIDQFFFKDDNERIYITWGSFNGIYLNELEYSGGSFSLSGDKTRIAGNFYEASLIHKRNGYYYLFLSNGSCCDGANSTYNVRVGRSENLSGPYMDESGNSLLSSSVIAGNQVVKSNQNSDGFAGPGHNAEIVTDDEGTNWFIYHAIENDNPYLPGGATRRPLLIDPLIWVNDWPLVNEYQPSVDEQTAPVFYE
ncbi:MAG: family 43 glycosylhydrolase [Bacteroidales bacterium]|nr:family 43 glycosylhydrolase [Bacteroidales bacterium]